MKWTLYGAGLGFLLAACADPQLGDLQQQLAEVSHGKGLPEPLALPNVINAPILDYPLGDRRSPFKSQRLEPEALPAAGDERMPDLERVREPLETYELEALHLVGVLARGAGPMVWSGCRVEKCTGYKRAAIWGAGTAG